MYILAQRYRMYHVLCICVVLSTIFSITESWAHGLEARVLENRQTASTVTFHYSDGSPASYTAVKVFSPNNYTVEFQNGRTDKNGRFSFIPDAEGLWRIKVNDGMGHTVSIDQAVGSIDGDITQGSEVGAKGYPSRFIYAILGCSLIMNMGFILLGLKKSKPEPSGLNIIS